MSNMENIKEGTQEEFADVVGKSNDARIKGIYIDNSMQFYLSQKSKGVKYGCCFVVKNVDLEIGIKANVFVLFEFESISKKKWIVTYDERIIFEEMEDEVLDRINQFNISHDNKVFYVDFEYEDDIFLTDYNFSV